ncbi:hypothetical protein LR48_Vigan153s000200 [Vigna angularis]|uniref:Uncharacterized protein n=1 Tax=Phaseolus angularis TaxID=3914 RepID=A0A0L9T4Z9_PHAAN|nr:hypothetical protein LR48_Vigan153s000200 [Vigna angularis]
MFNYSDVHPQLSALPWPTRPSMASIMLRQICQQTSNYSDVRPQLSGLPWPHKCFVKFGSKRSTIRTSVLNYPAFHGLPGLPLPTRPSMASQILRQIWQQTLKYLDVRPQLSGLTWPTRPSMASQILSQIWHQMFNYSDVHPQPFHGLLGHPWPCKYSANHLASSVEPQPSDSTRPPVASHSSKTIRPYHKRILANLTEGRRLWIFTKEISASLTKGRRPWIFTSTTSVQLFGHTPKESRSASPKVGDRGFASKEPRPTPSKDLTHKLFP